MIAIFIFFILNISIYIKISKTTLLELLKILIKIFLIFC